MSYSIVGKFTLLHNCPHVCSALIDDYLLAFVEKFRHRLVVLGSWLITAFSACSTDEPDLGDAVDCDLVDCCHFERCY